MTLYNDEPDIQNDMNNQDQLIAQCKVILARSIRIGSAIGDGPTQKHFIEERKDVLNDVLMKLIKVTEHQTMANMDKYDS